MLSACVTGAAPPGGSSNPTSDSAASNVRPPFMNPWNARARALMSMAASRSKCEPNDHSLELLGKFRLNQPGQRFNLDSLKLAIPLAHFSPAAPYWSC